MIHIIYKILSADLVCQCFRRDIAGLQLRGDKLSSQWKYFPFGKVFLPVPFLVVASFGTKIVFAWSIVSREIKAVTSLVIEAMGSCLDSSLLNIMSPVFMSATR